MKPTDQPADETVAITLTVVVPGLYGNAACQAGDVITVDDKKRAKQLIERGHCTAGGTPKKKAGKKSTGKPAGKKPSEGEAGETPADDDGKGEEPPADPKPEPEKKTGKKKPAPKK